MIIESIDQSIRGGKIWDEVAALEDPADQLSTALSDLFPQAQDLLAVVGRTFPERDPAEVLKNWADIVGELG